MAIALLRVDERLIHGQVVVGWGSVLRPARIVVVDDELAGSAWEQELYVLGLPDSIAADFVTTEQARGRLPTWRAESAAVFVLTRDIDTMLRLSAGRALAGAEVNIGGIHHTPGRSAVLPYVSLSEGDVRVLRALEAEDVSVSARDLPGSRRIGLEQLLRSMEGGR